MGKTMIRRHHLISLLASIVLLTSPASAAPFYDDLSAALTRTQVSLTFTPLGNGFTRWTTVSRWTNVSGTAIEDAYFLYLGQAVSTNFGASYQQMAWDDSNGRWQLGSITATPVDFAFYVSLSPESTDISLPPGLTTSDAVAAYLLGDIAAGGFVDVAIVRDISGQVTNITSTLLTPVSQIAAVPEPATLSLLWIGGAGLLGLGWRRRSRRG
jgi:hypothetical protein